MSQSQHSFKRFFPTVQLKTGSYYENDNEFEFPKEEEKTQTALPTKTPTVGTTPKTPTTSIHKPQIPTKRKTSTMAISSLEKIKQKQHQQQPQHRRRRPYSLCSADPVTTGPNNNHHRQDRSKQDHHNHRLCHSSSSSSSSPRLSSSCPVENGSISSSKQQDSPTTTTTTTATNRIVASDDPINLCDSDEETDQGTGATREGGGGRRKKFKRLKDSFELASSPQLELAVKSPNSNDHYQHGHSNDDSRTVSVPIPLPPNMRTNTEEMLQDDGSLALLSIIDLSNGTDDGDDDDDVVVDRDTNSCKIDEQVAQTTMDIPIPRKRKRQPLDLDHHKKTTISSDDVTAGAERNGGFWRIPKLKQVPTMRHPNNPRNEPTKTNVPTYADESNDVPARSVDATHDRFKLLMARHSTPVINTQGKNSSVSVQRTTGTLLPTTTTKTTSTTITTISRRQHTSLTLTKFNHHRKTTINCNTATIISNNKTPWMTRSKCVG
jgi:hypothetical protein